MIDLPVDNGTLSIEQFGESGPAVVCLPGLGDLASSYRFLAPLLAREGYRVYVMDLRGHGRSSADFEQYDAATLGRDVVALLDHQDLDAAHLVGCSMGAGAVAWVAGATPGRVLSVALLGAFVRDVPAPWWMGPVLRVLFARPWGAWAWSLYFKSLFKGTRPTDLDAVATTLRANLSEPGRLEATRAMMAATKAEVEAVLGDVRAPALVLMGTADPDFPDPRAEAELIAGRLGGPATVAVIDSVGHYPHVERPEVTARLVLELWGVARAA